MKDKQITFEGDVVESNDLIRKVMESISNDK